MFLENITNLLFPGNCDSKRKRTFLQWIKKIPTVKRCSMCRLNMNKLRVFCIDDFRKLEPEDGKEILDMVDNHNEIIVSIHNRDNKTLHEKIKEIKIKKIEEKEKSVVTEVSGSLFEGVAEADRPKKKIIIHGTNEYIGAMIGSFINHIKTKGGINMIEPSFTDIAKYLALMAEHPNGDPISWKSLNTEFANGINYTLTIEKNEK